MTEAELIESAGIYYSLVADMLSIYLSATSGFLIVAYLIGAKLTRSQLTIISGLYLVFAVVMSYLTVGYGIRGMAYGWLAAVVNPDVKVYATNFVTVGLGLVLVGGIFASFKFVWIVRHPET